MPFHLAAFGSSTLIPVAPAPVLLPPITDMYLPSTQTGFLLHVPMKVVAAYASSADGNLVRANISAPSLLRVSLPYIRPLGTHLGEPNDPNVMNLTHHPLTLPASENVGAFGVVQTPGTTGYALLWLCEHLVPVPSGEKFTLRFATTATTVQYQWTPMGSITFDQSLPPGTYTVIGFEHWNANSIAARLLFPGMAMRPGVLSVTAVGGRTDRLFFEGGLGVFGAFSSYAPPSFEVLSTESESEMHEGYLHVVRTGEAGHHLQPSQAPPAQGATAGSAWHPPASGGATKPLG